MENNELYHYGKKGQKWGERLYQNKDGSLTPLGRLRYQKNVNRVASQRKKNLEKARAAKVEKKKVEEDEKLTRDQASLQAGKISAKKMTNDELKARIDRLDLEKKYKEAVIDTRSYDRGKRFIDRFAYSTIDKVADNVAADIVAQTLKSLAVKGVNRMIGEEVVFTNNRRKN